MEELATGYGLVEGPVWDVDRGLFFADTRDNGVYLLRPDGSIKTVIANRPAVGGLAPHADGGLIVGGDDVIHWHPVSGVERHLLGPDVTDVAIGFNDLATDPAGRVWAGSIAFSALRGEKTKPGHLHVLETDGTVNTVADGVMLTNGIGFSPDGRTAYHADTRDHLIRKYGIADDGSIGSWTPFARLTPDAVPDGLVVAEDGSVWVALVGGSAVRVFEPNGDVRTEIPVPLPMVTSVCFGGDDLRDLYVVTGSRGGPRDPCGSIFRTRVAVPGLPVTPARV